MEWSEIMKRITVLLCILGLFHSLPIKTVITATAHTDSFKKIAVSEENIYILDREQRLVRIFTTSETEIGRFQIKPADSDIMPDPIDIAFGKESLYVLDAASEEVMVYDFNGALRRNIPFVNQYLQAPSAICYEDENLFIADIGCIWRIDIEGHVLKRIRTYPLLEGMPMQITDMTLDEGLLYVTDLTKSQVVLFAYPENWSVVEAWDPFLTISGYGDEPGRYYAPAGVAAKGDRVYVCDSLKESVDWQHRRTGEFEILPNAEWEGQHPTDLAIQEGNLWIVYRESERPRVLTLQETPRITCTPDQLDFGSVPSPQSDVLYFHLYSEEGWPFSGKIYSDNPYFTIREKIIRQQTCCSIRVEMESVEMDPDIPQTGLIHFIPDSREPITIKVKGRATKQKDLQLSVDQIHDTVQEDFWFPVLFNRQNGLNGSIECSFGKTDIPFLLSWKEPVMTDIRDREIANAILLEPATHFVEPGYYTIPVVVKCTEEKIIKTIQVPFIYQGWNGAVPGTMLGEYFAADWCCYCPSVVKAFPELHQKYTTNDINFLVYYNDCLHEDPKQLCFPEAETRMQSYNPSGMHRIMLMNGTDKLDQGYNDGKTTMTKEYDEYIQRVSPRISPVSLSGSAQYVAELRELTIGVRVECLKDLKWKDPRLFCVIAEHGIEFPAKNGLNVHNYVARDFISLENPEKNEAFGTPLLSPDGDLLRWEGDIWSNHLDVQLKKIINPANAFCVLIVQDLETKQLYQSRYVPLSEPGSESTKWLPERTDFILSPVGKTQVRAWFINQGDRVDTFDLEIFNRKPFMGEDLWKVGGNEYSIRQTVSITLNPMQATLVEFSLLPDFGKPEPPSLLVKATRKDRPDTKANALILPMKRFEKDRFTLLYPDESILDKEKGSPISLVVLKTDPGTVVIEGGLEGPEVDMAFYDGIVCFSLEEWFCLQEEKVILRFPSEEKVETLSFWIKLPLVMKFTIGSTRVQINQSFTIMEAAPFIMNSRTMVPIRIITESLVCGSKTDWDGSTQEINITTEDKVINIKVGRNYALVNGKQVVLDAPPVNRNGRIFLPLRFFAEVLGAVVKWDGKTQEITITR